jgi:hypothetical protein
MGFKLVTPEKAGVKKLLFLYSGFCRNDITRVSVTFDESIMIALQKDRSPFQKNTGIIPNANPV